MKKTKILFINHRMSYGGAQKALVNLLNEIVKFGNVDIDLFLVEKDGEFINDVPDKVNIINLSYTRKYLFKNKKYLSIIKKYTFAILNRLMGEIKFARFVRKFIINKKYDVEIGVKEGISRVYLAESQNKSSKKILWVHTDFRKFNIDKNIDRYFYGKADEIVCVSQTAKEGFISIFPEYSKKIKVVHNIIDDKIIKQNALLDSDPYEHNNINVVNVGRLVDAKAQDRLIQVHKQLIDEGIQHTLHIVGEGNNRNKLEEVINQYNLFDSVKLWGAKSNPYPFIYYADIYVHSSLFEGLPTVIFEALYLNKPIVTTKVSGVQEILQNGYYGLIVENNYNSLYKGYKEMLTNKKIREKYVIRTNEFHKSNEIIINALKEIFLIK